MRVFALTLALLAAPLAQANVMLDNIGTHSGSGEWKSKGGETGTFTITSVSTLSQDGDQKVIKLQSTLAIYQDGTLMDEEEGTTEIVLKAHGFFDVRRDGQIVGSGYCYDSVCHYSVVVDGMKGEETMKFEKGNIYFIGSWQDGKMKGAYKGVSALSSKK